MEYKTEVIILRSWKSKEYDRIYSVFSREHGKMRVVGIGTRRPKAKLASGLEPLTRSDIFLVKCRALDRVKGTIVLRQYIDLKKHLDNLIESKKTVNILEKLLGDNEPNEEIFVAIKDYFKIVDRLSGAHILIEKCQQRLGGRVISKNIPITQVLQLALFWKIIYWSGYFPRFKHCTYCNKKVEEKNSYEFILSQGINCGCQNNYSNYDNFNKNLKINLSKNTIKLITFLVSQKMSDIEKLKINNGDFQSLKQFTKLILEQIIERRVDI